MNIYDVLQKIIVVKRYMITPNIYSDEEKNMLDENEKKAARFDEIVKDI